MFKQRQGTARARDHVAERDTWRAVRLHGVMMYDLLTKSRNWFDEYTRSFADTSGKLSFMLQLKYDHSIRVADDCQIIAEQLKWHQHDIQIARASGLLHDIGRFTQFAEFQTFHDPDSIDHGERGYEVLLSSSLLEQMDEDTKTIILDSTRYHNRRDLQTGLTNNSVRILKLTRDADKVDIIHIVNYAIANNQHFEFPQIMLNIDLEGPVNPTLIEEIKTTGSGTYRHVHSLADMNLMRISWIYKLNYLPTYRLIAERNLLVDLLKTLPENKDILEIASAASDHITHKLQSLDKE